MIQPHQQRVIEEKLELDERRTKLNNFFDNSIFKDLSLGEQERLKHQAEVMTEYSSILAERIEAFSN